MAQTNQPAAQAPALKFEVTYTTLGQEIKLNANIVRNFLSRGNAPLTDAEIVQFVSICKYQQLNPFLNEAYPVKFKNGKTGMDDPATIIVSKEAFMKRAEGCEQYKGFRAGLILKRGDDLRYEEGEFMLPTDVLLGGWAEVYRDDRTYPIKSFVSLADYDKGRSTWSQIKCTMIRKVALVHAMREAFPTQLGALYTTDEIPQPEDVSYEEVAENKVAANANKQELPEEQPAAPEAPKPVEKPAAPAAPAENQMPSVFDNM